MVLELHNSKPLADKAKNDDGVVLEPHNSKLPANKDKMVDSGKVLDTKHDAGDPLLQGRRRSGRLKKDTALNTMEKVENIAKKRNLEGNNDTTNTFSSLPADDLVHSAADMGVLLNSDNLIAFDLFKTLEMARNDVYKMQCELAHISSVESENNKIDSDAHLELEWLDEDSSDPKNFILIESKKKREKRRRISRFLQ